MSDIGRWNGIDMLAESYVSTNPYAYVMNNPISFLDPDGRDTHFSGDDSKDNKDWFYGAFIQGDIPAGGGFGTPYNFGSSNAPNLSWDWINNILNKSSGNTTWTNNGSGFTSTNGTAIDYYGNWTSLNINYSNGGIGEKYIEIPMVYLSGNSSTWASQMQSQFNSYMEKWNTMQYWERINKGIAGFGFANDIKLQMIEYAVRNNFKSANSALEFNALRATQQEWRIVNTLGKNGAKYLKVAKGLGTIASVATTAYSSYQVYEQYNQGGVNTVLEHRDILDATVGTVGVMYQN